MDAKNCQIRLLFRQQKNDKRIFKNQLKWEHQQNYS
jgi:hypothetical protein